MALREQRLGFLIEEFALRRDGDPVFLVIQKLYVEFLLKVADGDGDRGLRHEKLFGGTLSLAAALQSTGAGEMIADKVIGMLGKEPSPYVLTFVVLLICCVLTNFMSNTATTALMAPICLSIAQGMGADPRAVLMACIIGGSCAYATPIGMPANTMVLGVGGYKFKDYAKSGVPLIIIAMVVSMIILPIAFPFFPG